MGWEALPTAREEKYDHRELDCRDFGCLHEKKIALSGINLITGGNEAGSPRRPFLRCMLTGCVAAEEGMRSDDYHRLIPWNQTQAEGSLCFPVRAEFPAASGVCRPAGKKRWNCSCTDDGEVLDVHG